MPLPRTCPWLWISDNDPIPRRHHWFLRIHMYERLEECQGSKEPTVRTLSTNIHTSMTSRLPVRIRIHPTRINPTPPIARKVML